MLRLGRSRPPVVAARRSRPRCRPQAPFAGASPAAAASPPRPGWRRFLRTWWLDVAKPEPSDASLSSSQRLRATAARLATLAREDWRLLLVASLFMVAAALAELTIPLLLSSSISLAASGETAAFASSVRLLLAGSLGYSLLAACRGTLFSVVNQRLSRRLRLRVYSAVLRSDISFFDATPTAELCSRLSSDCTAVARAVATNVNVLARNALQVLVGGALLFRLSPRLASVAAAAAAALFLCTARYGAFSRRAARGLQDAAAAANRCADESFALARVVRAAGAEAVEEARYCGVADEMLAINTRQSAAYGLYVASSNSLYHLSKALALAAAGGAALGGGGGGPAAATLTSFVLLLDVVLCSALAVADEWPAVADALGAGERVAALLDRPQAAQLREVAAAAEASPLLQPRLTAPAPAPPPPPPPPPPAAGRVELRGVTMAYPGRPPALRGVSLVVRAGETVALVGASGSGKSSLAALVARLYDPAEGSVLLDGVPLTDVDPAWLRTQVAIIGQEPRLFTDTLWNNIAYGQPGLSKNGGPPEDAGLAARVVAAAKAANADGFISALPQGYATVVGANGLSGGQRQRVAIARALLRAPRVLICDEATSALDGASEAAVQGALEAAMRGRTCLVIAHRLSTVRRADRILVLQDGRVEEEGNYLSLLLRNGLFTRLVRANLEEDTADGAAAAGTGAGAAAAAAAAPQQPQQGAAPQPTLSSPWPRAPGGGGGGGGGGGDGADAPRDGEPRLAVPAQ